MHSKKIISKLNKPVLYRTLVKDTVPDRLYYIKDLKNKFSFFASYSLNKLYESIWIPSLFDNLDLNKLKETLPPLMLAGVSFIIGEYVTSALSRYFFDDEEKDYIFKLLIGLSILSYSAAHRITDDKIDSFIKSTAAISSEMVGIAYLYAATFTGSRKLLTGQLSENYSLIASLGVSSIIIPTGLSYLAQKRYEKSIKKYYKKGAQRSDTAIIPSGLSSIANTYFLINHFLMKEIMTMSRLFQLGLISHNIIYSHHTIQKFRNLPALIVDVGPSLVKKYLLQKEKMESDYKYNNTKQSVIAFKEQIPNIIQLERYKLRKNDLVLCDENMDLSSCPISGEIVALKYGLNNKITLESEEKKVSINLKAHNGEDVWIEMKSKASLDDGVETVHLHRIRQGKQVGVLRGTKVNIFNSNNIVIQVKEEMEHNIDTTYEKKSVINDIINHYKRQNTQLAFVFSIVAGVFLSDNLSSYPIQLFHLLFNLCQMMIPFSESFVRGMINDRLIKKLNKDLLNSPLSTIDAMRIVDLCNAVGGYYHDRFPRGVAIVSDKTGTLTTSKMQALGCWTTSMSPDTQSLIHYDEKMQYVLPEQDEQLAAFEVFVSAYTNKTKELEPEEHSILRMVKKIFDDDDCLKVTTLSHNQYIKELRYGNTVKSFKTIHSELHGNLGGRFTLVSSSENKYLVYCGIPRQDPFQETALLEAYYKMNRREGVLSRDWCVARVSLSDDQFNELQIVLLESKKTHFESLICENHLKRLKHICTFIINNPVKKNAEKFISEFQDANVPVFVATGDTAKSAENISKLLFPRTNEIMTISPTEYKKISLNEFSSKTTIIFVGISTAILELIQDLMSQDKDKRPFIIFSEMSMKDKGILAEFLKQIGFFVVANGDGSNDIAMMRKSHMVIAHVTEEGMYNPDVQQYADINDEQLRLLLHTEKSFYELFDVHKSRSQFSQLFAPLMNSQEKPSIALMLKASKMSFELANAVGLPVKEMWQQHWFSVAFDLAWVWITLYEINQSTDLPLDNTHLGLSHFPTKCLLAVLAFSMLQSFITYYTRGESTNFTSMALMLGFLPILFKSIFSGYRHVQNNFYHEDDLNPPVEEKCGMNIKLNQSTLFGETERKKEVAEISNTLSFPRQDGLRRFPCN